MSPHEIFSRLKVNLIALDKNFDDVFLLLYIYALFVVLKCKRHLNFFENIKQILFSCNTR